MSPMLDVSDDVRAEIGDDEANRLLSGDNAPGSYDCTSCRAPGDTDQIPTSTVLFVGEETAVLAFAHAACVPSQVVRVSEEEVQGAVRTITADAAAAGQAAPHGAPAAGPVPAQAQAPAPAAAPAPAQAAPSGHGPTPAPGVAVAQRAPEPVPAPAPAPAPPYASAPPHSGLVPAPAQHPVPAQAAAGQQDRQPGQQGSERAVLGVTCGQILIDDTVHAAVVVEPTSRISRPGSDGQSDDFLPLLLEQGFLPVNGLTQCPGPVPGWSVLVAMGRLHAILQPPAGGTVQQNVWWQAHQPLPVTDGWRNAANQSNTVLVYAAPVGAIGQQPREDLLREALVQAAAQGVLVGAAMPLAGS